MGTSFCKKSLQYILKSKKEKKDLLTLVSEKLWQISRKYYPAL